MHSRAGFQTAYVLTHSNLFSCGNVGAGVINMAAFCFDFHSSGLPGMFKYEIEQGRIGADLQENQAAYPASSPILNADKIKTPVLISHNDKADSVSFNQGINLFLAMRRLNKPAWLLNYKGEGHTLESPAVQHDRTLRME